MNRAFTIGIGAAIVFGSLLAVQGWRDHTPTFDLIPHLVDARALVSRGEIPTRGCLSSYGAAIPPGTTWLMAPGVAMFSDSRLVKYPATLLLFAATAVGLALLAKECFGPTAGLWAAAIYCVSDRGLFFASTLWPRGHPAFIVWFVLALIWWVKRRDGRWLAAGLLSWAVGLYVFMETLPAIFAVPLVWLRWKPPIRWRSLGVAVAFGVLVWSPYLLDQAKCRGRDLLALLRRQTLDLPDVTPFLCDPNAKVVSKTGAEMWPNPAPGQTPAGPPPAAKWQVLWAGLVDNFGKWTPFAAFWLAFVVVGGALAARSRASAAQSDARGVLLRCVFVPWLLLLLMAETEPTLAGRRLWWMAPLQTALGVGGVCLWCGRFTALRTLTLAGLTIFSLLAGRGSDSLADWRDHGFAGRDAEPWQILARIARQSDGPEVSVSYRVQIWAHMFRFHPLDRRYKIGWEWDELLKHDFRRINTTKCPEGVSKDSEFVVIERDLEAGFPVAEEPTDVVIYQSPKYEVRRRIRVPAAQTPP